MTDLLDRLRELQVSSICDADKSLPVVDPAIRAWCRTCRWPGPR